MKDSDREMRSQILVEQNGQLFRLLIPYRHVTWLNTIGPARDINISYCGRIKSRRCVRRNINVNRLHMWKCLRYICLTNGMNSTD